MRALLALLAGLVLQAALSQDQAANVPANPAYFRYTREVKPASPAATRQTAVCAPLDAAVFEHAAPTLADLRLYGAGATALPYVLTTSQSTLLPPDPGRLLNPGRSASGHIVFDVAMPPRPYTELDLDLAASGFVAVAHVTGLQTLSAAHAGPQPVDLGSVTLFDLTGQRLSRSTVIPLEESTFPFLHVDLDVQPSAGSPFVSAPAMVMGVSVPPSREAQTLYTTLLATSAFVQRGHQTVATLELPAHLPVERVTFVLSPGDHTAFSRTVHLTAVPSGPAAQPSSPAEHVDGEISRVEMHGAAFDRLLGPAGIHAQQLSVPATLAANLNAPAHLEIAVDNGDDPPVSFTSVRLEMRERKLCFPATPAPVTLMYDDPALAAPAYDFARLFNPAVPATVATLGPEEENGVYHPRPVRARSFTDRHPELLWLALLAGVGVLALVAFRSGRHIQPGPGSIDDQP